MDGPQRLFSNCALCPDCSLRELCGAMMTDKACPDVWTATLPGGAAVSHPTKPQTLTEIHRLSGVGFDDIVALPVPAINLEPYTPQPRFRTSLHGKLKENIYILRAKEVVKRSRVTSAAEMREALGLDAQQRLVLLPFDDDRLIEDMWSRGESLIRDLAAAKYDAIVAPSFSTYIPRPRTEYLINMRRSMVYFCALQRAGVWAIPRVSWNISYDARRLATWVRANPKVKMVAIDLATHRVPSDWSEQLQGLAIFDSETNQTVTYLVNGPSTHDRCRELFEIVDPSRIRITNATTQVMVPTPSIRSPGDQTGVTFGARVATCRSVIETATTEYQWSRAIADTAA